MKAKQGTASLEGIIWDAYGRELAPRMLAILSNICVPSQIKLPLAFTENLPLFANSLTELRERANQASKLSQQASALASEYGALEEAKEGHYTKKKDKGRCEEIATELGEICRAAGDLVEGRDRSRVVDWLQEFESSARSASYVNECRLNDIQRMTVGDILPATYVNKTEFERTVEKALKN